MYGKWKRQLSACLLFTGVKAEELNIMLQCLHPVVREYSKNECVTMEGQDFSGVGVVLEGEVLVTKENAAGSRVIIAALSEGEIFGEMVAFSGERLWPATVIAQREGRVMFLPPEQIVGNCQRQCPSHRRLITNMLRVVSNRALQLNKKVQYLSIKSMRGKICAFLMEQHKKCGMTTFLLPLKRNELADFLNVTRPSLSREMGRLKEEGIIDFHRSSVKIKDLEAVKRLAE